MAEHTVGRVGASRGQCLGAIGQPATSENVIISFDSKGFRVFCDNSIDLSSATVVTSLKAGELIIVRVIRD